MKQSMCRSTQWVCESLPRRTAASTQMVTATAKTLVPALVNGTKEKNQVVKSAAEMALIALLLMKEGETGAQVCTNFFSRILPFLRRVKLKF